MQHLKSGELVTLHKDGNYYVFLILSPSAFFGCQWAFAFHKVHLSLPGVSDIGLNQPQGFVALIDFIKPRRSNSIIRISKGIDPKPFLNFDLVKALIRMPGQDALWYIYDRHNSAILRKTYTLSRQEIDFPIWSGVHAYDTIHLIEAKWDPSVLVSPAVSGQYPLPKNDG
jgi:hypothetical protein